MLLIDEGQDLSPLQWKVIWFIAKHSKCKRIVIAGDDDQAIFRWAGADVDLFLSLEGEVQVLGQSWRVPQEVQKISNGVVSKISRRHTKRWSPRSAIGQVDWVNEIERVDFDGQNILVLVRNAFLIEQIIEPELKLRGMIYEFRDRLSIDEEQLKAIIAWEALRSDQTIFIEEAKLIYEYMTAGKGYRTGYSELHQFPNDAQVSMMDLKNNGGLLRHDIWHEALDRLPIHQVTYLLAARRRGEKLKGKPRIKLSTIHAAKGGEANHVVLLTDMAQRTWREQDRWPDDEARVWYVATTRAREHLTIISPQTKMFYPL